MHSYIQKFCRWLVILVAIPIIIFIIWQGGLYSLWRLQGLLLAYDLVPPQTINNSDNPDPEFARVSRIEVQIAHLNQRLMQITSGIPVIDFFAGAHEKEQLLTETIALYSQIIDHSAWKDSKMLTTYYINRGVTYSELGQYEKALDDLNIALRLSPDDALSLKNRAIVYEERGLPDKALNDFERFLIITDSESKLWQSHREFAQKQVEALRQKLGRHG